mgnify:CR=1 FL=1|tara:strand:- start:27535 stop:27741 length:207 start_codon:yes stop_codon:yes gene_type:complete
MTKQDYLVTEKAGLFVAGKRSPGVGKTMSLTPDQAEYGLIARELQDPTKAKEKPTKKPVPLAAPDQAE